MKQFIKKNWRIWFCLYVFIYLPWFFFLEQANPIDAPNMHIIHTVIDDYIPFCEYFIVPYVIWFLYIFVSCLFIYIKGTDKEYLRLAISLIVGMSLCLLICMIYPNGLDLRPETFPRDNIFTRVVAAFYATDTSTNVFPSIHVYNSLALHISLAKCKALQGKTWIKNISLITCILICASTVFLKQHSIIDVIGGCALMVVLYWLIYSLDYAKLYARYRERTNSITKKKIIESEN